MYSMRIGFTEILVILAVALIMLGPDKLPAYMKKFGQAVREFRKYSSELTEDLKENVIAPLDEAQRPLREALEPLESLDKELKANVKDLESSIRDIGKAKPAEAPAADAPESPEPAPQAEAQRKLCLCPATGIRHDFLLPVCLQGIHALYSVLPDPRGRGQ